MIYTLAGLGVALGTHFISPDYMIGVGLITLAMVAMIVVCMATERGLWPLWKRILAVPAAWVAQGILGWPAMIFGRVLCLVGLPAYSEYATVYIASAPLVLWAMWHSRLFVQEVPREAPVEQAGAME